MKVEAGIRKAERDDAPHIVQFQIDMAKETEELDLDRETVEQGVLAVFDHPSRGTYYVGEIDGTVVSSLLITYEWSDWRNGPIWWIQSVWVDSIARGTGVFRAMFELVKTEAIAAGVKGLRLYVDRRNERAQEVYRRLGMKGDHYLVFEEMDLA